MLEAASTMQHPPPAPTAQGTFAKTPLPHLLVYAAERRLSGSFDLAVDGVPVATMLVVQGSPAKVRTADDRPTELARQLEQLFTLPPETTYAYYDGVDRLSGWGGSATPIDPWPVLWRGIKAAPPWGHVEATLRRVGSVAIRLGAAVQLERLELEGAELDAAELVRDRAVRIVDLVHGNVLPPAVAQQLVYFLVITKQVEFVDASSAIPPAPDSATGANQAGRSQAFARLQLQAKPIARTPMVVEEVAASPANDERASIPGTPSPVQPPTPMEEGPDGIHALIADTIASSLPVAAPEPSPAGLTAEQNALKAKILERAEKITSQNYFEMLGVDPQATAEGVQKAFLALAKVWHPDRLPPALADVKDACSKVFSHLTEAHATLSDPKKRQDYMTLVKDGGATPDDQARIQTILEAATEFQKAEILMKRNALDPQVFELVRRAVALDPDQADYMALYAWLESQLPQSQSRDKTKEKIAVLDRCIQKNPSSERAYYYRAMLYKRIDEGAKAIRDFKKVAELNPRNLDAAREVRLHHMRGGSKPPPAGTPGSSRGTKGGQPEARGGLFGKLFKK